MNTTRRLEFVQRSLEHPRKRIIVYEPSDEQAFIDIFSTPPHESNITTPTYVEGVGPCEISTRALHWMALQRANSHRPNFCERFCYDFVATFLKQDLEEDVSFRPTIHYLPSYDSIFVTGEIQPRINRVLLNTALILGTTSGDLCDDGRQLLDPEHSVIVVTESGKTPQLFMSKLGNKSGVFVHTLPTVAELYDSTHYAEVQISDYRNPEMQS